MKRLLLAALPAIAVSLLVGAGRPGAGDLYRRRHRRLQQQLLPAAGEGIGQGLLQHDLHPHGGTVENVNKVLADPKNIGFGQLDVVALLASQNPDVDKKLQVIRDDVAKECLFIITNNDRLISIEDLGKYASRISLVLPPKDSGRRRDVRTVAESQSGRAGQSHQHHLCGPQRRHGEAGAG